MYGDRIKIEETCYDEKGFPSHIPHDDCERCRVWDWPGYSGGACPACEAKFSTEWDKHHVRLTTYITWYLAKCGIGKRHLKCTIGNFKGSSSVKEACQSIAQKPVDDLRHTFASHAVMAGVDLTTLKELLGHKTLAMTLRYAQLAPSHKVNAVAMLYEKLNKTSTSHLLHKIKGHENGSAS